MHARDYADDLLRYRDYAPTAFDAKGLPHNDGADRGDWIVVPVGQNRDSDCLSESNFAQALEALGGESNTIEVHRFRHWACGWFEIILAHPDCALDVAEIACALDGYPILNEEDYSRREHEAADQAWQDFACRDTAREIQKRENLSDRACDLLEADGGWPLREALESRESAYTAGGSIVFPSIRRLTRDTIAKILRDARKGAR